MSGRIDAVFGESVEAPWEIVDWKTGDVPQPTTHSRDSSSSSTGSRASRCGGSAPRTSRSPICTWPAARRSPIRWAIRTRCGPVSRSRCGRSARARSIRSPAPWCHHCDFLSFCEAGRAWIGAGGVNRSVRGVGLETFDLLREPAVVRSRVVAAHGHAGNGPRDQARLGRARGPARPPGTTPRSPGCRTDSPLVPGYRSDGSSTTTGTGRNARSIDALSSGSSASTTTRPPSHVAEATAGGGDGGGGGGPGCGGAGARLGGFREGMELDPERAHLASERSTRRTILASDARSARARSASSFTSFRNEARVSRRSDSGVSATTEADRGRPSSKEISPK